MEMMKKIKQFFNKNLINNSNDILKICIISLLCMLLLNRKYNLQILVSISFLSAVSYYFTKNILTSLLISLILSYALLTYFYKVKMEQFESFRNHKEHEIKIPESIFNKLKELEKNEVSIKSFEDWKKHIGVNNLEEANYYVNDYKGLAFKKEIVDLANEYITKNKK